MRAVLNEGEIVAAALEIIEESGVEGLTMRHLSEKLGVALGATYHHVPNKHALLVLVANAIYAGIEVPERMGGDWRGQVRTLLLNVTMVMRGYPGVAAYSLRHPSEIPMVHVIEATRELLSDARRVEDVERHLAERELEVVLTLGLDRQPERLAVELLGARDVLRQHGHEVDLFDLHQGVVPSGYGA